MENMTLHILLADDDLADQNLFIEALKELKIKCAVNTVDNGMQLMEYLAKIEVMPNLLFLDLNMPRKNGMECLKEIRSNPDFKNILIAVYSTSAAEKDIDETFLNGANVYIKKPNDFATLKQLLRKAVTTSYLYQDGSFDRENFFLCI